MSKKYFFGWENIRWGIKNIILIYSSKSSFFSKKRIESGIGFVIAEWGMVFWLLKKYDVMTTTDFGIWASIQFFVAGYILNQIEKAKDKITGEDSNLNATITTTITTDNGSNPPTDPSNDPSNGEVIN